MKMHQKAAEVVALAQIKKGCATFLVGTEMEYGPPRRFAVPVELLVHPRIMELLGEAQEEYAYAYEGAVVLPCGVERFQKAVDAAWAQERQRHHQHRHHHNFSLPQLVGCFRLPHVVV